MIKGILAATILSSLMAGPSLLQSPVRFPPTATRSIPPINS